jgi:uncharacterized cupredoxin-like copper-binding protein
MSTRERIVLRRISGWLMTVGIAAGLVACAPSGGGGSPTNQGPRTVQVQMSDELRFEPAEFTFQAGETVRFEVTNAGAIVHEFLIGDEAAQGDFEMEMSEEGGMAHDGEAGVSVEPGQSETFEYTFAEAGDLLAGCHESGHYDGGMKATITVEG